MHPCSKTVNVDRYCLQVLAGSPAANIGLQPGDEIVQVGNTNTARLTHQQVLDLIDSIRSNTLVMTVERFVSYILTYLLIVLCVL